MITLKEGRYSTPFGDITVSDRGDCFELRFVKGRSDIVWRFKRDGTFYNFQIGRNTLEVTKASQSPFVVCCSHIKNPEETQIYRIEGNLVCSYACKKCIRKTLELADAEAELEIMTKQQFEALGKTIVSANEN